MAVQITWDALVTSVQVALAFSEATQHSSNKVCMHSKNKVGACGLVVGYA